MKYIRTKDGRIICYEVINETVMSDDFIYGYGAVMKGKKEGFEIEKIADTIEELCDEFVYVDEGCYPEISDELDLMQTKSTIIYGAIWTDKGLTYVAKMNDKGEFELL